MDQPQPFRAMALTILLGSFVLLALSALTACGGGPSDAGAPHDLSSPGLDSDFALPADLARPADGGACGMKCSKCAMNAICAGEGSNFYDYFAATCLKTCKGPGDCPMGFRCYERFGDPVDLVCISDLLPSTNCSPGAICDLFGPTTCRDASTLRKSAIDDARGLCGYDLTHCENGCLEQTDGGISAHCK